MIREYIIKISDEIMEEEIADKPKELVRCKDCKQRGDIVCPFTLEDEDGETIDLTMDEWFCFQGERTGV